MNEIRLFKRAGLLVAIAALLVPQIADAQTQTFEATQTVNGYTFHARVDFTLDTSTNTFNVVLTNLGDAASVNGHVLTAVFWEDEYGGLYGRQSASVTAGSTVRVNPTGAIYSGTQTVAQHWAYRNSGPPPGFNQGISAIGTGIFGSGDTFAPGGSNPVLNGVDWGLVNGTVAAGVSGGQTPFIHNSATFVLSGLNANTVFQRIRFQFGSDVATGYHMDVPRVPEGSSLAMLAGGGLPLVGFLRRRRRCN